MKALHVKMYGTQLKNKQKPEGNETERVKAVFFNINKVNKTLYETENKNVLDKFRNTECRKTMRNS